MTDRPGPNYHDPSCGYGHTAPRTPDVPGSLWGLRAWALTTDGYLRGATYAIPWATGWNDAACLVTRRETAPRFDDRPAYGHPFWKGIHDAQSGVVFPLEPGEPITFENGWRSDPCQGLDPKCGCGFYAYYDESAGRVVAYGNIRGVVEAAGRCVVGPKGFRAQRARVVAVVRPTNFKQRFAGVTQREINSLTSTMNVLRQTKSSLRLRPWFGGGNRFAVLWGTAVGMLALLGDGTSDRMSLLGSAAVVLTIVGVLTAAQRFRTRRLRDGIDLAVAHYQAQRDELVAEPDLDGLMTLMQEHYPGVKVYDSMEALLKDYPTSDVRGLLGVDFTNDGEVC